tara:strand:+ start:609 stop:773 length:165 start_codon:yes stop_codon:yes gene_type:complete
MKPGELVYVDSDVGLVVSEAYLLKKGVYMIDIIFKGKKRKIRTTCARKVCSEKG